ncbi:hypothetical protein [Streptomyces sp. NPDC002588]|uniref:hypothetical protein n=1 Tax=Streptomyces sp. NPDC002588 TaxID=3154419 RepID=UPI00333114D8
MSIPQDRRPAPPEQDDYSATVLDSHWVVRPGDDTTVPAPAGGGTLHGDVAGTVLRFGPGVTATRSYAVPTTPVPAAPPRRPRRRLRRHTLPVLVLLAAVLFLLWRQPPTSGLSVRAVAVTAPQRATGCDRTADVVGVVRTDGRPGELAYRWVRSDGTSSGVLHATVAEGRREVLLHLLWTFRGRGRYAASAELRVLSPDGGAARAGLRYDCR